MTIYLTAEAAAAAGLAPRGNKYHARPVYWCPVCAVYQDGARCPRHGRAAGGISFDSGAESVEHARLVLRVRLGEIRDLRVHTRWPLVVAGIQVGTYEADFDFTDVATGELVVIDVKGKATVKLPLFREHCALMRALHRITVQVVMADR